MKLLKESALVSICDGTVRDSLNNIFASRVPVESYRSHSESHASLLKHKHITTPPLALHPPIPPIPPTSLTHPLHPPHALTQGTRILQQDPNTQHNTIDKRLQHIQTTLNTLSLAITNLGVRMDGCASVSHEVDHESISHEVDYESISHEVDHESISHEVDHESITHKVECEPTSRKVGRDSASHKVDSTVISTTPQKNPAPRLAAVSSLTHATVLIKRAAYITRSSKSANAISVLHKERVMKLHNESRR